MLSPEDIAWADSCLTIDTDSLDSGWNSLKEALLETISFHHDSSTYENGPNFPDIAKMEISSSTEKENIERKKKTNVLNHENTDDLWSKHTMGNIFLSAYNENSREIGALDSDMDFVSQEFELEQSTEDIFKLWNLEIPPTEEDLIKPLNKDSTKGLKDLSLDDLISRISRLSLSPISG